MSSPKRQRIRIAVDTASQGSLLDAIAGAIPTIVRGTDAQLELAFLNNGSLLDISSWATVTLNIKDVNGLQGVNLAQGVVGTASYLPEGGAAWNASLLLDDWNSGASQHCIIVLDNASTNLSFPGSQQYLWMSILATSNFNGTTNFSYGLNYSGAGSVSVTGLTVGASYYWTQGANDTNCVVDGSTILTSSGQFFATATSVTLNGTASLSVSGTIVEQYSTSQQTGYGQASILDSGIVLPAPSTVFTPTYLTVAAGDARYPNGESIATISSLFSALQLLPITNTGSTDPNTAMLAGKSGDQYVMIVAGVFIKTMVKTTGTFVTPTTGGWS